MSLKSADDEGLHAVDDAIGGHPGFWSTQRYGLNVGVEGPQLGIDRDTFGFPNSIKKLL